MFVKTKSNDTAPSNDLKVPAAKNSLSFVACNSVNTKTSIVLDYEQDPTSSMIGTQSNPIELLGKPVKFCAACGCYGHYCHDRGYRHSCVRAVFAYVHNSTKLGNFVENWTSCSEEAIVSVFKRTYNERRKGDLESRFDYHCPDWKDLPKCMTKNSLEKALGLNFNPGLIHGLKMKNEEGYKKYCKARGEYCV